MIFTWMKEFLLLLIKLRFNLFDWSSFALLILLILQVSKLILLLEFHLELKVLATLSLLRAVHFSLSIYQGFIISLSTPYFLLYYCAFLYEEVWLFKIFYFRNLLWKDFHIAQTKICCYLFVDELNIYHFIRWLMIYSSVQKWPLFHI